MTDLFYDYYTLLNKGNNTIYINQLTIVIKYYIEFLRCDYQLW